jgi:hypothetical protein
MSSFISMFGPPRRAAGAALGLVGLVVLLCASGGDALAARPVGTVRAASDAPQPAVDLAAGLQPPSRRFSPAMAYDGARRDVLLFGGATFQDGALAPLADTWTWDGHGWTQRFPAHSPSARAFSEMAYDPVHRQVVLFGGLGLNDTWLWDGRDWTQAAPAFNPVSTIEEGMTFFPATCTVVMYSGNFTGPVHLYSWDGANWTDVPFGGGPPDSAFQGGLSVDPVRGVLVLLAVDINQIGVMQQWEFDGRTWTHRDVPTPPSRSLAQTVTDERTDTIVLFGGVEVNDTWTWDGLRWTQRQPRHTPPVRSSTGPMPGMAYDAARGEVVVFGGSNMGTPLNDTWTWNGRDWKQR